MNKENCMKNKKLIWLPILLFSILLVGYMLTINILTYIENSKLLTVDFDGRTIMYENREYTIQPQLQVHKSNISYKIGKTEDGLIVYKIQGLSSEEWLSIGVNNIFGVYKAKSVSDIDLRKSDIRKMDIVHPNRANKIKKTIEDSKLISSLIGTMENEHNQEMVGLKDIEKTLVLHLELNNYKGISYIVTYEKTKNNKYYLYDIDKNEHHYIDDENIINTIGKI